ncbi:MAG: hypothetical protein AB7S26_05635 [Sandaracinaceae bacterium]
MVPLALPFVLAAGCKATIPSGRFACDDTADCPPDQLCVDNLCELPRRRDGGGGVDASRDDAGRDAGRPDAGGIDAGLADSGASDGGPPDAPTCTTTAMRIAVAADTVLSTAECLAANHQGFYEYLQLGIGHGMFRFRLPSTVTAAISEGRVIGARLIFNRASFCRGTCPATTPGHVDVFPARSDWDEGSTGASGQPQMDYAGADWCRRRANASSRMWDADGASGVPADVGGVAVGALDYMTVESPLTIELDTRELWSDFQMRGGDALTLQTRATGVVIVATREAGAAVDPELELDVCTP